MKLHTKIILVVTFIAFAVGVVAYVPTPDPAYPLDFEALDACYHAPNYADYGYTCKELFQPGCSPELSLQEFLTVYLTDTDSNPPSDQELVDDWILPLQNTEYYPCVIPAESALVDSRNDLFVWAVDQLDWWPKQENFDTQCAPDFLDRLEGYCTTEQLDAFNCACNKWNELKGDPAAHAVASAGECAGTMESVTTPKHMADAFDEGAGGVTGYNCSAEGCLFDKGYIEEMDPADSANWKQVKVCNLETNFSGEHHTSLNASMGAAASGNAMVSNTLRTNAAETGINLAAAYTARKDRLDDQAYAFGAPGWEQEVSDPSGQNTIVATATAVQDKRALYNSSSLLPETYDHFDSIPGADIQDFAPGSFFGSNLQVQTCDEYAYEKYYRYSRYQDEVAKLGRDYREILNLSMGRSAHDPGEEAKIVGENMLDDRADVYGYAPNFPEKSEFPPKSIETMDSLGGAVEEFMGVDLGTIPVPQNDFFAIDFDINSIIDSISPSATPAQKYDALTANPCLSYLQFLARPVFGFDEADSQAPNGRNLAEEIENHIASETPYRVPHDLAWHEEMSRQLSKLPELTQAEIDAHGGAAAVASLYREEGEGYDDEQLYSYDILKEELDRLLGIRDEMAKQAQMEETMACQNRNLSIEQMADIAGVPTRKRFEHDGDRICPSGQAGEFCDEDYYYWSSFNSEVDPDPDFSLADLPEKEDRALVKLFEIDRQLGLLLQTAFDLGCYEVYTGGSDTPSACDWSPRIFNEDMMFASLDQKREFALDACITATAGQPFYAIGGRKFMSTEPEETAYVGLGDFDIFTVIADFSRFHPDVQIGSAWGGTPCTEQPNNPDCYIDNPMLVFMSTSKHFDEYIRTWRSALQYRRAQAQKETRAQIDAYNESGKSKTDTVEKGNDHLSAYYDYDFDYGLFSFNGIWGDVKSLAGGDTGDGLIAMLTDPIRPRANAGVEAGLKIFGDECPIIEVKGKVGTTEFSSWPKNISSDGFGISDVAEYEFLVELMGVEVFECSSNDCSGHGEKMNDALQEAKSRFTVGPVPMSVTAGIAGGLGIDFTPILDYKIPNNILAPLDPANFRSEVTDEGTTIYLDEKIGDDMDAYMDGLKFKGTAGLSFAPYMKLDAFAQVAIDLGILAAGIEARLTVFDIRFPFSTGLEFSAPMGIVQEYDPAVPGMVTSLMMKDINLLFFGKLDAHMRFLDGKVSAFAKVDLLFWEKTYRKKLFGWTGLALDIPIFSFEKTLFNIEDPFYVLEDLSFAPGFNFVPCLNGNLIEEGGAECLPADFLCIVGSACPAFEDVPCWTNSSECDPLNDLFKGNN